MPNYQHTPTHWGERGDPLSRANHSGANYIPKPGEREAEKKRLDKEAKAAARKKTAAGKVEITQSHQNLYDHIKKYSTSYGMPAKRVLQPFKFHSDEGRTELSEVKKLLKDLELVGMIGTRDIPKTKFSGGAITGKYYYADP